MTLANAFFAFIAVSSRFQIVAASKQSTLYRDDEIYFGNLKQHFEKSLSVERVASILVKDPELACIFKCISEPKCFSINVASQGDSKGLYLCELLTTDKYRAKNMLWANASFHHYSFMVSIMHFKLLFFVFRRAVLQLEVFGHFVCNMCASVTSPFCGSEKNPRSR